MAYSTRCQQNTSEDSDVDWSRIAASNFQRSSNYIPAPRILLNPTPSPTFLPSPGTSFNGQMSAEEAAFLHNLYNLNVPAEEIARMMEVMRAGRQDTSRAGQSLINPTITGLPAHGLTPDDAPPQYEPNRS
jgi:hypothetical protein